MSKPTVTSHGFSPGNYAFYDVEDIEIGQWCRDSLAELPPEQVHLTMNVRGIKAPLVVRFKGPDTLGALIEQLIQHRREVWPDAPEVGQ